MGGGGVERMRRMQTNVLNDYMFSYYFFSILHHFMSYHCIEKKTHTDTHTHAIHTLIHFYSIKMLSLSLLIFSPTSYSPPIVHPSLFNIIHLIIMSFQVFDLRVVNDYVNGCIV